jgi:hypothetical protein
MRQLLPLLNQVAEAEAGSLVEEAGSVVQEAGILFAVEVSLICF